LFIGEAFASAGAFFFTKTTNKKEFNMCKLSTAQKKFIKAAMKKNEEISDAEHFEANGSWNKLKKLGKPGVSVAELNDFISFERLQKRFGNCNLTPGDKQNIIKTNEYAISKGSWFDEIASIAIDLIEEAEYLEDDETLMTALMIINLAQTQRGNIYRRNNSEKPKSEEESLFSIMEIFSEAFEID
jgi:hypothetical protein